MLVLEPADSVNDYPTRRRSLLVCNTTVPSLLLIDSMIPGLIGQLGSVAPPSPRFDFFVCVCVCVCCFRFVLCWHLHDFDVDCLWWWWWWWWKKPNRRPKTNQRCGVWWRRWASTFSWSACAPSTPSRRATCPKTSTRPNSSASPCTRRASSGWPLCPSTSAPSPRPSRSASASPYRKTFSFLLGFPNLPWGRDPYPEPAPPAPKRRNLIDMENNRFNQGTHLFDGFPNSFWGRDPLPWTRFAERKKVTLLLWNTIDKSKQETHPFDGFPNSFGVVTPVGVVTHH